VVLPKNLCGITEKKWTDATQTLMANTKKRNSVRIRSIHGFLYESAK